MDAHWGLLVE
ncbi:MAG TPA: hypothetical protein EYQ18_24765 [Candidatus Handelsmanbacteria bacterium]|nr:hypothetical protein [Candidatus Handelsmanbacteria bacterium]